MTQTQTHNPVHPADILLSLIVAILAPLFLTASGGNIDFARMAALETVQSYRARNHVDLIAVAQIIACGLSALGSLSLAMTDDISLSMTIRLRGSATGLMRCAEQVRRAMQETQPDIAPAHQPAQDHDIYAAAVIANVAAVQQHAAEHQSQTQPLAPARAEDKAPEQPAATAESAEQRHLDALWASAMTRVASEFTASIPHLPPHERKQASYRAAILNSTANELITGSAPPRSNRGVLNPPIRPGAS